MAVEFKLLEPMNFFDFDTKVFKPHWRKMGNTMNKRIRRKLSRHGLSKPGEAPGLQTGRLRSANRVVLARSGFSVAVYPRLRSGEVYFPAPLVYGHTAPGALKRARAWDKRMLPKREILSLKHRLKTLKKVAQPRLNVWDEVAKQFGDKEYPDEAKKMMEDAIKPGVIR